MTRNRRFLIALVVVLGCGLLAKISMAADNRLRWNKTKWGPVISHKHFPKDCGLCHTAKNWGVLREDFHFDHKKETGFALEGAHAFASCIRCHNDRGPVKEYVARGCAGCHVDPHRGANGLDCKRCHDENSWRVQGAIAAHARTTFPLSGRHLTLQCEECHSRAAAGDYRGAPSECYRCHRADYQRAPNHVANAFSTVCWKCHNTVSFSAARFDHSGLGATPNCFACHAADYQRAPNHVSGGFPTTCWQCHNTTSFAGAQFNHSFLGANPVCMNCHAADYQRAPNHVSGGFPTTCGQCHNTTSFAGAQFNHSFLGANPVCMNCHAADYNRAPNHSTVGFPTTCASCHTIGGSWAGATLNHPFPQNHQGATCMQCHQGGTPQNFTCVGCHPLATINATHAGRAGFTPNPTPSQCVACHPTGGGG